MFSSLFLIAASFIHGDVVSYREAIVIAERDKKPLVVLVGATWCVPCQKMKAEIRKLDRSVVVCYVDVDVDPDLARRMMDGDTVPQVVIYSKERAGWRRLRHVGAMTLDRVLQMVDRAKRVVLN
jgi:thiol-disulfide isomerase/thioredoxin